MAVNPNFNKILSEALKSNKPTNADRIRAMSDEELAEWIWGRYCPDNRQNTVCVSEELGQPEACEQCWLDWLQSPVGGDRDG